MEESEIKELRDKIIPAYNTDQLNRLDISEQEHHHWKRFQLVPIDLIKKAAWNYKESNSRKQEQLTTIIEELDQIENTHVRELDDGMMEMINGNHRLDAYRHLGKEYVYCYNHGHVTFDEAAKRAIQTNETKFQADDLKLSKLMKGIAEKIDTEEVLKSMPFTDEEMSKMAQLAEFDWPDEQDDGQEQAEVDFDDPTMKTIKLTVPANVHERWKQWQHRVNSILGYDSDWKAFEFAVEEAMQIPEDILEDTA